MNIISRDYADHGIIGISVLIFVLSAYLSENLIYPLLTLAVFAGLVFYMRSKYYSGIVCPFFVILAGQPFVFSLAESGMLYGFFMEFALGLYYIFMNVGKRRDIIVFSAGIFLFLAVGYLMAGFLNIYLFTVFAGGVLSAIFAAGIFTEHNAGKKIKRSD
ncbi:hypothetical protein [Methanoplanus endosymbiosus]|uniref:Uncharacterized protein n=1 Tax=Methanoplanus endosymbiosus TaxID=33865 RepID=A0A9E7TH40_9EURY|nr:hypothetical protein [Methanoplanus endosymbiosus]UUX92187.1 hypothetical protein L6E24_12640 [Methanoplanus endosymbiosus]